MITKQKPVTVLTGFLGAGKTTLLNAILRRKKNIRFAIIENEVGEIGIDGDLIIKDSDSFTELNNGCICCSLNENFTRTLKELSKRTDWDELIIEATGIANPGGILAPFKEFPWLEKHFSVPQVICIADAQNVKEQLRVSDTAASQLAYGQHIISKSDLIPVEQLDGIHDLVSGFNPFAQVSIGNKSDIPISTLLERRNEELSLPPRQKGDKHADHHHHHGHDHLEALSLEYDTSFNGNKLFASLYAFVLLQATNIYRVKGIFHDARKENQQVIQSVMKSVYLEDGDQWRDGEKKNSRFVFIGKHLDRSMLDELLTNCQQ